MNLQRAHAGRDVEDAGESGGAQLRFQRVHAEAQVEVEHVGAVLDQQRRGRHRRGTTTPGAWREDRVSSRACRALEADQVAGAELADLPQLVVADGGGADEAAEARTVGAEDHRHVAGEIHRADRVRVVVDVGRMQPRFAAVLARPRGLRPDQAHAGAVGIVMHLPRRREEHLDVFGREEIGRAVRPVEHPDLPLVRVFGGTGLQALSVRAKLGPSPRCSTSPARSTRPACPPKPPRMKVLRLPRYSGTSMPPAIARYARLPAPCARAEFQQRARRHRHRLPARHRRAIQTRAEIRAGERDRGVAGEAQRGPHDGDLQARRALGIPHQPIGGAERQVVHRTGRRHADMPVAEPSRIVLHRGLHAAIRSRRRRGGDSRSRAGTTS